MKLANKLLSALTLVLVFGHTAQATPVNWTINEFTNTLERYVPDPGTESGYLHTFTFETVSGSFTYDADTNTLSNLSLVSSLFGDSFKTLRYGSTNANTFLTVRGLYSPGVRGSVTYGFTTANALTNAGGVVTATVRGSTTLPGSRTFLTNNVIFTGTPQVTAVPEPEAYAMMLAGLGLVGFAARRKQQ